MPTKNMVYNTREPELSDEDKEILNSQINMCDGILMPGGVRIFNYDRYICKYVNDNHIPLLGICMGMQLMTLYNNSNKNVKVENHNFYTHPNKQELTSDYLHDVTIDKKSKLYKIIQYEKITVNSYHGYGALNGGDYKVCATCDNVIEAIEKKDELFNIGVQWHPEKSIDENGKKLFDAFINACKANTFINSVF